MVRPAVFDPTEPDVLMASRQRFDYRLLLNGFVHRVADGDDLRRAGRLLGDLGYRVHALDAAHWTTESDVHDAWAAALDFFSGYGRNLDAFNDVLRDVAEFEYGSDPTSTGTAVLVDSYDQLVRYEPRFALHVPDIFAGQARYAALLGHPMILLLRCDARLGPVGGASVHLADVPPVGPGPGRPLDRS